MQLHVYVPDALGDAIRRRADAAGVSVSRYLGDLLAREVGAGWPDGFFERVVGGWQGSPLERPEQGEIERRDGW
jgi:hypothetical protein